MPKNTTGGKGHKRAKNSINQDKPLIYADDQQFYAKVLKKLGGCRFSVNVYITPLKNKQGEFIRHESVKPNQIACLRGSLRRWRVEVGNIILVSLRDFEEGKVDIIHIYKFDDITKLKRKNMLPEKLINDNSGEQEVNFINDNDAEEEEEEVFEEVKRQSSKTSYSTNFDLIPDTEFDNEDEAFIDEL